MGEDYSDEVPAPVSSLSEKLEQKMTEAGLDQVKSLCENAGILTYHCLGGVGDEDIRQLCATARSAGFGFGHCRTLQALWQTAKEEASRNEPSDRTDIAPAVASALSPMLCAELARRGLQKLHPILRHCGVQSFSCLCQLSEADLAELEQTIRLAGFKLGHVQALRELRRKDETKAEPKTEVKAEEARGASESSCGSRELLQPAAASPVALALGSPNSPKSPLKDEAADSGDSQSDIDKPAERSVVKQPLLEGASPSRGTPTRGLKRKTSEMVTPPRPVVPENPKPKRSRSNASDASSVDSRRAKAEFCAAMVRPSRQFIQDIVNSTRSLSAEVVKVRDRVSGKMVAQRIPEAIMSLLRLRATCLGKEESDQKIARMALDVLEEQGFDPVRAVASLAPDSMLCPSTAMRVLGSGAIGVAFLEEDTEVVAKVMLEDFAGQEFRVFNAFAKRGLAPTPKELIGPHKVPAGPLYCIKMEKVSATLDKVLLKKVPRGPRHGLDPPSLETAQKLGAAVAAGLKGMSKWGLVHGDLHLENIGLKDMDSQCTVQLIDFGRAATCAGLQVDPGDSLVAGHEYDVFRLIRELIDSFDEVLQDHRDYIKECEKEVRELKQGREQVAAGASASTSQLHHARMLNGLQAWLAEEPKAMEQLEKVYNIILSAVVKYSKDTFDTKYDGMPTVRNRKVRRVANSREGAAFKCYFKSDLFWGGETAD